MRAQPAESRRQVWICAITARQKHALVPQLRSQLAGQRDAQMRFRYVLDGKFSLRGGLRGRWANGGNTRGPAGLRQTKAQRG